MPLSAFEQNDWFPLNLGAILLHSHMHSICKKVLLSCKVLIWRVSWQIDMYLFSSSPPSTYEFGWISTVYGNHLPTWKWYLQENNSMHTRDPNGYAIHTCSSLHTQWLQGSTQHDTFRFQGNAVKISLIWDSMYSVFEPNFTFACVYSSILWSWNQNWFWYFDTFTHVLRTLEYGKIVSGTCPAILWDFRNELNEW